MSESTERTITWHLEYLRITAFLKQPVEDAEDHWHDVIGAPPERYSEQRQGGSKVYLAQSDHQQLGRIGLQVDGLMSKIDWLLGAVSLIGSDQLDPVGPKLEEALPQLAGFRTGLAEKLANKPVQRLAIGMTVLGDAFQDRQAGYQAISGYLPNLKLDPDSSDFFYRINRPRKSSLLPTYINRLSDWSVTMRLAASVSHAGGQVSTRTEFRPRIQLDVNTAADYAEAIAQPAEVLNELMETALEVTVQGDVK